MISLMIYFVIFCVATGVAGLWTGDYAFAALGFAGLGVVACAFDAGLRSDE